MIYRLLADALVLLHLLFIFFGLLGGLLMLWRKWMLLIHLPAAFWISIIEFKGWTCPLTPMEKDLRVLAGQEGYPGGFVEHYILPVIYPAGLTPEIQVALGIFAIVVNIMAYGYAVFRIRSRS